MSERVRRVNELMREVLGDAIGELNDPSVARVTITAVDCTRDFEHATVFFQASGNEMKQERALQGLMRAKGVLQARIAREVRLRRTPHLRFSYDGSIDYGSRMERLIAENPPLDEPIVLDTE